jgi:predicted secreted protein
VNQALRSARVGLVLCAALLSSEGRANDAAARRIIGFSPDGRYFAFEQYGTQDWSDNQSGYSEIAVIDTDDDAFVGGKPIKVVDERENSGITEEQARRRAAAQAAPLLAKYAIALRGTRVAFDKLTFPDEALGRDYIFRVEDVSMKQLLISETDDATRLSYVELEDLLADSAADCTGSSAEGKPPIPSSKARGFRLSVHRLDGDANTSKVLHEDKSVPASRDCPTSYSLSEAYVLEPKSGTPVIAILVQRFSQGWEGRDRRFIAVTGKVR